MESPSQPSREFQLPVVSGFCQCSQPYTCQVRGCANSMAPLKEYYRKRRVCPDCSRAESVLLDEQLELGPQRFCQQCGRFHPLSEFDNTRRSCRAALRKRRQQPPRGGVSKRFPYDADFQPSGPGNLPPSPTNSSEADMAAHALPSASQGLNPALMLEVLGTKEVLSHPHTSERTLGQNHAHGRRMVSSSDCQLSDGYDQGMQGGGLLQQGQQQHQFHHEGQQSSVGLQQQLCQVQDLLQQLLLQLQQQQQPQQQHVQNSTGTAPQLAGAGGGGRAEADQQAARDELLKQLLLLHNGALCKSGSLQQQQQQHLPENNRQHQQQQVPEDSKQHQLQMMVDVAYSDQLPSCDLVAHQQQVVSGGGAMGGEGQQIPPGFPTSACHELHLNPSALFAAGLSGDFHGQSVFGLLQGPGQVADLDTGATAAAPAIAREGGNALVQESPSCASQLTDGTLDTHQHQQQQQQPQQEHTALWQGARQSSLSEIAAAAPTIAESGHVAMAPRCGMTSPVGSNAAPAAARNAEAAVAGNVLAPGPEWGLGSNTLQAQPEKMLHMMEGAEEDGVDAFLADCLVDWDASEEPPLELTTSFAAAAATSIAAQAQAGGSGGIMDTSMVMGIAGAGYGDNKRLEICSSVQPAAGQSSGPAQRWSGAVKPELQDALGLHLPVTTSATAGAGGHGVLGYEPKLSTTEPLPASVLPPLAATRVATACSLAASLWPPPPSSASQPLSMLVPTSGAIMQASLPGLGALVNPSQQKQQGLLQVPWQEAPSALGNSNSILGYAAAIVAAASGAAGATGKSGGSGPSCSDGAGDQSSLEQRIVDLLQTSSNAVGNMNALAEVEQLQQQMEQIQEQLSNMCRGALDRHLRGSNWASLSLEQHPLPGRPPT